MDKWDILFWCGFILYIYSIAGIFSERSKYPYIGIIIDEEMIKYMPILLFGLCVCLYTNTKTIR